MGRQQKLIRLLETIKAKISENTDIVWTNYNSVGDLKRHLDTLIQAIRHNDKKVYYELELLFAPTGSLQELSISNGWGEEFLHLAEKFDSLKPLPQWKIIGGYICGVLLILFVYWLYHTSKNDKYLLTNSGQVTQGIIIKTVDRRRGLDLQYEFLVSGKRYTSWEKTYKEISIGDTLQVVFLPTDPTINRLKFQLTEK